MTFRRFQHRKRAGLIAAFAAVAVGAALITPVASRAQRATPAVSVQTVAARVQHFYDQMGSLDARFEQRYYHKLYQTTQRSSGRLAFEKPGRMRFDYAAPNGKVVVSDGSHLIAWEPGDGGAGQHVEAPVTEDALPGAFGFLLGTARIGRDYDYRLLDATRYRWRGHVLELRPREADPNVARVLLFVDGRNGREGVVHKLRIVDHEGNMNQFTFGSMRFNRGVDDARFAWQPPSGSRRIER